MYGYITVFQKLKCMKFHIILISFLVIAKIVAAQITITQADMPHAGNNYINTGLLADVLLDPTESGPNHVWDFQQLIPLVSSTDTFTNLTGLPAIYQLLFFGANLSDKVGSSLAFDQLMLEDVYTVFKGTSNTFEQYGFAGTFAGIPIPIVYNQKDVIYRFPLQYGNVDSSFSGFTFFLPGLIFISQDRKRVNVTDGWGTVSTPAGTYQALRVTSTLTDVDSVFLDTLNNGSKLELKSYEYKWLAQGTGLPVLQINAQDVLGTPVITQITYLDTALHTGISSPPLVKGHLANIYPNPAANWLQIQQTENMPIKISVRNLSGQIILNCNLEQSISFIDVSAWSNGIYFLNMQGKNSMQQTTFVVQH